jgi:hypothetical protein
MLPAPCWRLIIGLVMNPLRTAPPMKNLLPIEISKFRTQNWFFLLLLVMANHLSVPRWPSELYKYLQPSVPSLSYIL